MLKSNALFVLTAFSSIYYSQTVPIRGEHFEMSVAEVTNGEYLSYLKDQDYDSKLLPDTLVWRSKGGYNEPYTEYYLRHPAYRNYPVVGVSYDQAQLYCNWLTQKKNAFLKTCNKCEHETVQYRLPTEKEWMYSARGGNNTNELPWPQQGFRNTHKKHKGEMMANFVRATGDFDWGIGSLNDNADVTAPVHSYWPNAFGLYTMAGNVAEMVQEKGIAKGGSWRDQANKLKISNLSSV